MVSSYDKNPEPFKPGLRGWLILVVFLALVVWVTWQLATRT